jgi:methionyl-tRNA synthetase
MSRQILVTAALPYANGHIHIGHLVEYIQTDIWVRFQKLVGNRCIFICADDTHGTAIMIRARAEKRPETELIADMQKAHLKDFSAFDIEFDNYGSTNSESTRRFCHEIWASLRTANLVNEKPVTQLFDPEVGTFLADRFVKGTCPKCKSPNQYGDSCDNCGSTYTPADLIDPKSTLSGATPEVRTADHLFVDIEQLHEFLETWTQTGDHLQTEVANYLKGHFLSEPLREWDVSRPAPYFGFEIPDSKGNYWYVWFDAPIGYIGSTQDWCDKHSENINDWWKSDKTEIHHFIGKDITYFHTLFWPAMLKTAGFTLPTKVHIHGFLKVDGEKMSKTKGTFINASTYAKFLDPQALRYYFATRLNGRNEDLDLNLQDFVDRVNSDLVGKVVNIASRTAKFIAGQTLAETYPDDGGLFETFKSKGDALKQFYEAADTAAAMREIMSLADLANKYVEDKQPWTLKKDPAKAEELNAVCSVALNLFRQLVIYLSPVLPKLAQQTAELLGDPIMSWTQVEKPLTGTTVNNFSHMMKRLELAQVEAMIESSKQDNIPAQPAAAAAPATNPSEETQIFMVDSGEPLSKEPLAEECTIEDFMKVDLRVARVVEANHVEGANKLLQLTLSLGGDVRKNVFAGIKSAYKPEDLVGQLVICVANLKPRQMKFGLSEGMICAAGEGGKEVFVLKPDTGARPGQRVH